MGYFSGLTSGSFKKGKNGDNLFYPWGVFGVGYTLESDEKAKDFKRKHMIMYAIVPVGTIFFGIYFGRLASLFLLLAFCVGYYAFVKHFTAGLSRSSERLTYSEHLSGTTKAFGLPILIILAVLGSLMTLAALLVLFISEGSDVLAALAGIGFFGFCTAFFLYLIRLNLKLRGNKGQG